MTTYKQAGVDMEMGDKCSALAYEAAKATFAVRKNMIGAPVNLQESFTGLMDFGDFYMVQNSDGVGSKIMVAEMIGKYDTLGYDLLAMVADDAVCAGAETVAINDTIDTNKVSSGMVGQMMDGLKKACLAEKVIISGGEIGEMPDLLKGSTWNASAIGVVEKNKFIHGREVKAGDPIIGLRSRGFRSNGFALVRKILGKKFGAGWARQKYEGDFLKAGSQKIGNRRSATWGEVVLTPSLIYSGALLTILGRYGQARVCAVKALAHVTGGGVPGNLPRVLGGGARNLLGAHLDELWEPHEPMLQLQQFGKVPDREAYEVWNMGIGMLLISREFAKIAKLLKAHGIEAKIVGEVTKKPGVNLVSKGFFASGKVLRF